MHLVTLITDQVQQGKSISRKEGWPGFEYLRSASMRSAQFFQIQYSRFGPPLLLNIEFAIIHLKPDFHCGFQLGVMFRLTCLHEIPVRAGRPRGGLRGLSITDHQRW